MLETYINSMVNIIIQEVLQHLPDLEFKKLIRYTITNDLIVLEFECGLISKPEKVLFFYKENKIYTIKEGF